MFNIFKNAGFWIGIGGFAAGMFVTSKCARKIAVKSMAAGMKARDGVKTGWDNIKEEASDIYEEAKEEAAAKADDDIEEAAPAEVKAAKAAPKAAPKKKR